MLVAMNRIRYSTAVIALLVLTDFADAQERCQTPKKTQGLCINVTLCPTIVARLLSPQRKPKDDKFLRDSKCGYIGDIPKVCCDDDLPCTTPSGELGVCQSFASCTSFMWVINSFRHQTAMKYMRDSVCQGLAQYSVCCGETVPDFGAPAPPADLVFDAKRCGLQATEEKIFGGAKAAIDQYPWLALLEYRAPNGQIKLLCGAALIGPKYTLTAAHCVQGKILNKGVPESVRLGEHDINNLGRDCQVPPGGGEDCTDGHLSIPIEEIIRHPGYQWRSKLQHDDIALVRLRTPAPYTDFIRHICMPTVDVSRNLKSDSLNFSVGGWGETKSGKLSNTKMFVEVPFKTLDQCQTGYRPTVKQLCAGGVNGKDSCNGDSGGPLMHKNEKNRYEVVGVVSFGWKVCGTPGVPAIYSKVTEYMDWIRSVVRR